MDEEKDIPENKEPSTPPVDDENVSSKEGVSLLSTPNTQFESPAMEVHKHPHHVTHKKNWKEYLLEFFMIFLAVFLGFIAENVREHIVEKDRARQYAKSLISDLQNDTAMINDEIATIDGLIKRIDSLTISMDVSSIKQINNLDLFRKTMIGFYKPYTWSRATLDQIKNSGSLRYFDGDSIIYKISAYDAFTRHMDEDYYVDLTQKNKTVTQREQIIDMNYPDEFVSLLGTNYDSLKTTRDYEKMKLYKSLLTTDITQIKVFVNEFLNLKGNLRIRQKFELPRLMKNASELIQLLKQEYHLN